MFVLRVDDSLVIDILVGDVDKSEALLRIRTCPRLSIRRLVWLVCMRKKCILLLRVCGCNVEVPGCTPVGGMNTFSLHGWLHPPVI